MKTSNIFWHYTSCVHFQKITTCNQLKVSAFEKKIGIKYPALWFSTNQIWEPTATKLISKGSGIYRMTKEEQYTCIGLVRISTLKTERFIGWEEYNMLNKVPKREVIAMEKLGTALGASPNDWYASLHNISLASFHAIQLWNGKEWDDRKNCFNLSHTLTAWPQKSSFL